MNLTAACTALGTLIIIASSCSAAGCSRESYGIVARLGNDTVSIENIRRTRGRVVSDVAERSPRALRKHWEAKLREDGSVRHFEMETRLLNPGPDEPHVVHTTIEFGADSVRTTERIGDDTKYGALPAAAPVTAPWNTYVYGTYELLLADAAAHGTDSVFIQQQIPGYGLGYGVVRRRADGSMTFTSTRLAGTGIAQLDERGRLVSYDGSNTTYKQLVERTAGDADIDAIAARFGDKEKAAPGNWLSVRDTARVTVGAAEITIDYGRPLARGRTIIGNVVPYGRVWRTGANLATHLTTTAPISIGTVQLEPGTYTLWTLPEPGRATLIINRQTGQWGTGYGRAHDVGRTAFTIDTLTAVTEAFTIAIEPGDIGQAGSAATLVMEWDRFRWTAPISHRTAAR